MTISRAGESPSWMLASLPLLLAAAATPPVDLPEERPIPEPTDLAVLATQRSARVVWSADAGEVESADARAVLTAVTLAGAHGRRLRGVRIRLENAGARDEVYLGEDALAQLHEELASLEPQGGGAGSSCDARRVCMRGVARCRPSQTVPQALCPVFYQTAEGQVGLGLSTPRHAFRFPSQRPSVLADAIEAAADRLEPLRDPP